MKPGLFNKIALAAALGMALAVPARADDAAYQPQSFEASFDNTFGTQAREPRTFEAVYQSPFERHVAQLADGSDGRIGFYAVDLATGRQFGVLGDQRFPMASTSKIAIAATFMEGVEKGRWSLSSEFPLMIPVKSAKYSTSVAPVRPGKYLPASQLLQMMLTHSNNYATDALLKVVGGPAAVNDWVRRAGIKDWRLDRDIATLVRDDGEHDPATFIDKRDSATPRAMTQLLIGLYQGRWLSKGSRDFIIQTMENCVTGKRRIPALLPADVTVAHKTGSLHNTSSDVGIIQAPDGRAIAVAIYVTGQGSRLDREKRIASIAEAIYEGYTDFDKSHQDTGRNWVSASYTN